MEVALALPWCGLCEMFLYLQCLRSFVTPNMGLAASKQEAFWEACGFGHKDRVRKFIEDGIDVNWVSYTVCTTNLLFYIRLRLTFYVFNLLSFVFKADLVCQVI